MQSLPPKVVALLVHKSAPVHRGEGETQERGRPLQTGRWQVLQARELTDQACPGHRKTRFSTPTCQIFQVSIKALPGASRIPSPDGLTPTCLSQGCVFRAKANKAHIPSKGGGGEPLVTQVWLSGQTCSHTFLMTFPNKVTEGSEARGAGPGVEPRRLLGVNVKGSVFISAAGQGPGLRAVGGPGDIRTLSFLTELAARHKERVVEKRPPAAPCQHPSVRVMSPAPARTCLCFEGY